MALLSSTDTGTFPTPSPSDPRSRGSAGRARGRGSWRQARGRALLERLLEPAGVTIDGDRPWDPQVLDPRFFTRALAGGRRGVLDAYVDGWWECERLDELTARVLAGGGRALAHASPLGLALDAVASVLLNRQSRRRSGQVRRHYDLGNDLFAAMLDRRLTYSCGYWRDAATLDEAQEAKLDLVCRKVGIEPGMRVLDVGCGWGSFAAFAAERYGARLVGVTLSPEQLALGLERTAGLPVELRLQDYRELAADRERFDRVVSIGMFEHVGYKNYRTFFDVCRRLLTDDGLLLLHTIGGNRSTRSIDPWIEANVFPGGMLPSARQVTAAWEGRFVLEDWHSFGADYDRTLMAWHERFEAAWSRLAERYGERFHRLWRCYLLTCAGSFRARYNQLWQIVLSPRGVVGGYRRVS